MTQVPIPGTLLKPGTYTITVFASDADGATAQCSTKLVIDPVDERLPAPRLAALEEDFRQRLVGIGAAWTLGLLMDVANGALLGQHAFAYSVLAFAAAQFSRRILWFTIWPQALHAFLLLFASQLLMLLVRMSAGGGFPGVAWFAGSGIAAMLWPAVTFLLLLPQRRPILI